MPAGSYLFIPFLSTKSQMGQTKKIGQAKNCINIAGRLPENSRNSFVDLQSQKYSKKADKELRLFIEG